MFFMCCFANSRSLESDLARIESRTIPYLASIIVENRVRAAFLLVRLSSLILAHFLLSGVFWYFRFGSVYW